MQMNMQDAKTHLSQLVDRAMAGDEVVIARANRPMVRLTPINQDVSPRQGGFWAGNVVFHGSWEESDRAVQALFDQAIESGEEQ
jgi:prevent-host-death family protein